MFRDEHSIFSLIAGVIVLNIIFVILRSKIILSEKIFVDYGAVYIIRSVLVFGLPKDFNGLNLPTEQEVLQCFFYLFDQSKMINKMYSFKTLTPCVVDKLFLIWGKIDIPLINKLSIAKKLKTLIAKYKTESKNRTTYEAFVQSTKKMYFILQNVDVL